MEYRSNKSEAIGAVTKFLLGGLSSRIKQVTKDTDRNLFEAVIPAMDKFLISDSKRGFYYMTSSLKQEIFLAYKLENTMPLPLPDFYAEVIKGDNDNLEVIGHLFNDSIKQDLLTGKAVARPALITPNDALFGGQEHIKQEFLAYMKGALSRHIHGYHTSPTVDRRWITLKNIADTPDLSKYNYGLPFWLIEAIAVTGEIQTMPSQTYSTTYLLFDTLPIDVSESVLQNLMLENLCELARLNVTADHDYYELIDNARTLYRTHKVDDAMKENVANMCNKIWNDPRPQIIDTLFASAIASFVLHPTYMAVLIYDLHFAGVTPEAMQARIFNLVQEAQRLSRAQM